MSNEYEQDFLMLFNGAFFLLSAQNQCIWKTLTFSMNLCLFDETY